MQPFDRQLLIKRGPIIFIKRGPIIFFATLCVLWLCLGDFPIHGCDELHAIAFCTTLASIDNPIRPKTLLR